MSVTRIPIARIPSIPKPRIPELQARIRILEAENARIRELTELEPRILARLLEAYPACECLLDRVVPTVHIPECGTQRKIAEEIGVPISSAIVPAEGT